MANRTRVTALTLWTGEAPSGQTEPGWNVKPGDIIHNDVPVESQ